MNQLNKLKNAIEVYDFVNSCLQDVKAGCNNILNLKFNYFECDNLDFYESYKEKARMASKELNLMELYSIEEAETLLKEYKEKNDLTFKLIGEIDEVIEDALFLVNNYYNNVFLALQEIFSVQEFSEEFGDYVCEKLSKKFYQNNIPYQMINADYVINVMKEMNDELIESYIVMFDNKIKELSIDRYVDTGLEIFKREETVEEKEERENAYLNDIDTIIKNAEKNRF